VSVSTNSSNVNVIVPLSAMLALLVRFSDSAAQRLHDYRFISFNMSLGLGNVPSLPRLSAQVDTSALDKEREPGVFFSLRAKKPRSQDVRYQRE